MLPARLRRLTPIRRTLVGNMFTVGDYLLAPVPTTRHRGRNAWLVIYPNNTVHVRCYSFRAAVRQARESAGEAHKHRFDEDGFCKCGLSI